MFVFVVVWTTLALWAMAGVLSTLYEGRSGDHFVLKLTTKRRESLCRHITIQQLLVQGTVAPRHADITK